MIHFTEKNGVKIGKFTDHSRFTLAITEDVKAKLKPVLSQRGTKFVFDLDNINFIDSSGIGCIISLMNTAKNCDSSIKLCNISPENKKIFELLNLHKILDIHHDINSAVESFE